MPCPPIPVPSAVDVIDDDMINDALTTSGIKEWESAEALDLSFRRVAKIENIVCFDNLATLSLSNNRIETVENLSHLTSLTTLDLSFNLIQVLPEELTKLSNLQEFSLHSNMLSDLSVVDELQQLKVLNIGRNKVATLEAFLPLRKLKHLRALTAAGNPCAEKSMDDYEAFLLAYLGKTVRWLDYRVADSEKVASCREQFQNELEVLAGNEGIKQAEEDQAEADKANHAALRKIYMLEAVTLFDVLIKGDEHLPKIARMDGLSDLEDALKSDLGEIVEALRAEMTSRCKAINEDEAEYKERLEREYQLAQESSVGAVKGLRRSRKHLFAKELLCSLPPRVEALGEVHDMSHVEKKCRAYKVEVASAREDLEALEADTESKALKLIDAFEDNYSAMMTGLTDLLAEFFQKAMNHANKFYDSLKDLAVTTIADYGDDPANEAPDSSMQEGDEEGAESSKKEPVDEYAVLLSNIDALMEVVNGSHERHESIILQYDERVRKSVRETLHSNLSYYKEREFDRSRVVTKDISSTCSELVASVDEAYEVMRAKHERY